MRLFFGIYPPASVQEEAAVFRDRIRDDRARPTKTSKLHITLQFLGDHESDTAAIEAAREVHHAPFRLTLATFGDFGHVYWLGVEDATAITALANDLGASLRARGFHLEERAYHPHLTLARTRRAKPQEIEAHTSPFDVTEFALIESVGGSYVTRATFKLEQTPTRP